jgi:P-type Cu2+ transporter
MRLLTAAVAAALLLYGTPVKAEKAGPDIHETALSVSGMLCSSCAAAVETVLKKLAGVRDAQADVKADRVSVRYDGKKVTPRQMVEALRKAGYQARWPETPAPPAPARAR